MRVFVLDGDGSLLMNLGSLATIGLLRPANLVLVVMDNEEYATTGGQQTPTAHGADLEAAARAMGIARTATVRTEAELTARSITCEPVQRRPSVDRRQSRGVGANRQAAPRLRRIKQRFMAAIGCPEPATIGQPLPQSQP